MRDSQEPLTADSRAAFGRVATEMADRGLRVLAFAHRVLPIGYVLADAEQDLVLTALVGFEDPPRPEVPSAVRRCREAGIKVVMVTGDHPHTALAIAREIGLVTSAAPRLLTGDDLARMSDIEIQLALDAPEIVCARVTADQKLRVVTALQRKREVVAVTGDGVNDAPALRAADVGIAMGISGTDVAREASDVILLDDNFASIVNGIEEGRAVFENIRKFLTLHPDVEHPRAGPLPGIRVRAGAARPHDHSDPGCGSRHRHGPGPRSWRGTTGSRGDATSTTATRGSAALTPGLLVRAYVFLGSCQAIAAMAAFFFVLSRSWVGVGTATPSRQHDVSASHHRLPDRHRAHAGRQRAPVPKPAVVHLFATALRQQTDHGRHRRRDRDHSVDRLHAGRSCSLRDGAYRLERLVDRSTVCDRHADARRGEEGIHAITRREEEPIQIGTFADGDPATLAARRQILRSTPALP